MISCRTCRIIDPQRIALKCSTCVKAERDSAVLCPEGWSIRKRSRCRLYPRSKHRSAAPVSGKSARPWPLCEFWRLCCETNIWASASCLSCRMKRVPLAWRVCSASWVFIPLRDSSTNPRIPMSWPRTKNRNPARSWKKALTKRVRLRHGWRLPPRTQPINTPYCRSTFITLCSAFSELVIWHGQQAICKPRGFCWAVRLAERRSMARGCSIRMATPTCWRPPYPTASAMTQPMPLSWL